MEEVWVGFALIMFAMILNNFEIVLTVYLPKKCK